MTFLHNAGKFDSQVGQCVFCNQHKKKAFKVIKQSLCSISIPSPPLENRFAFFPHIFPR